LSPFSPKFSPLNRETSQGFVVGRGTVGSAIATSGEPTVGLRLAARRKLVGSNTDAMREGTIHRQKNFQTIV
jgi:hypothetical protein